MIHVLDASAAVEFLLKTPVGARVETVTLRSRRLVPELFDAEVLSVLRRLVLSSSVSLALANSALQELQTWRLTRLRHRDLVAAAWALRHRVSAYDAFYLAAAMRHGAIVVTADGRLSRANVPGVTIHNIR